MYARDFSNFFFIFFIRQLRSLLLANMAAQLEPTFLGNDFSILPHPLACQFFLMFQIDDVAFTRIQCGRQCAADPITLVLPL